MSRRVAVAGVGSRVTDGTVGLALRLVTCWLVAFSWRSGFGTCCDGTCYSMTPWDTSPLTCNKCRRGSKDGDDCVFKNYGYTQWSSCYHGTCTNECCIPGGRHPSSCVFVECSLRFSSFDLSTLPPTCLRCPPGRGGQASPSRACTAVPCLVCDGVPPKILSSG